MVLTQDHQGDGMFSKAIAIRTKGASITSYHHQHQSPLEMKSFSPVGSPRNVTVHLVVEGYQVTWDMPDFGLDSIRHYNVRWFRGSIDELAGSVNTTDLSHTSKFYLYQTFTYLLHMLFSLICSSLPSGRQYVHLHSVLCIGGLSSSKREGHSNGACL